MTLTKPIGYTTVQPGTILIYSNGLKFVVGVKGELFPVEIPSVKA